MKKKSFQIISDADADTQNLFKKARLARKKAYAPYSGCHVGAAVRTQSGKFYSGCNVENASYGGSNCAERVAIQKAVSEGDLQLTHVMVVTDAPQPWPPCGFCRQVMSEFGEKIKIYWANTQGQYHESTLEGLLPHSFTQKSF